jgi:hypothetical protein
MNNSAASLGSMQQTWRYLWDLFSEIHEGFEATSSFFRHLKVEKLKLYFTKTGIIHAVVRVGL